MNTAILRNVVSATPYRAGLRLRVWSAVTTVLFIAQTASCQTQLVCGETVGGNITFPTQIMTNIFSGSAGEVISLGFFWSGNNNNGDLEFFYPGADAPAAVVEVGAEIDGIGGGTNLTLPSTGTYTLLVHEKTFSSTGAYSLSLQSLTGGGCNAQPIDCGQAFETNTSYETELDEYTFSGSAGEVISLGFFWSGNNNNGDLEFFYPGADAPAAVVEVGAEIDGIGGGTNLTLPSTGTYTLLVHEKTFSSTGAYSLSLQSLTGGGCNAQPIDCGQAFETNTSYETELDEYTFSGSAGEVISLGFFWSGNNNNGDLEFFYPGADAPAAVVEVGAEIDGIGGGTNLTLPSTGTYTLLVHEKTFSSTGAYSLSLQSLTGGGCNAQPIDCGQAFETNTSYETELDEYTFSGSAGEVISLGFFWSGNNNNGDLEFFYPGADAPAAVVEVGAEIDGIGGGTNLTLPSTGTYTLLVHEKTFSSTGAYSLSLQSLTGGGCDAILMSCGGTIAGQISEAAQVQAYRFAGTAGQRAIFIARGFGLAAFDIYDPTGRSVASLGPGSTNFTLFSDGYYSVLAHANDYVSAGSYTQTVFTPDCLIASSVPVVHLINDAGESIDQAFSTNNVFVTDFEGTNDVTLTALAGSVWSQPHAIDTFGEGYSSGNPFYITNFLGQAADGTGDGIPGDLEDVSIQVGATIQFDFAQPLTPNDRFLLIDCDNSEAYQIVSYIQTGTTYTPVSGWTLQNFSGSTLQSANGLYPIWYPNASGGELVSGAQGTDLNEPITVLTPSEPFTRITVQMLEGTGSNWLHLQFVHLTNSNSAFPVPPSITNQPVSVTTNEDTTVKFSVGATGTAPLAYQWQFDGQNLQGATDATLTLTTVQINQAGWYAVIITNVAGSVNSSSVLLTVNVPPEITQQPGGVTTNQGANVSFSVTATGTMPLAYQWSFNGTNVPNATNSTLSISGAQFSDVGSYAVSVTNDAGSTTSSNAILNVIVSGPPIITQQPVSVITNQGSSVKFTVGAAGLPPLSYQWMFNGTNIAGGTESSYAISSTSSRSFGNYRVVVSNFAGAITSGNASLTIFDQSLYAGITVKGRPGSSFAIQAVPNVEETNWTILTNATLESSPFFYLDLKPPPYSTQFYRAVLPEPQE